ncbi:hypothetical protein [Acetonema longum]|uniref:Uncharacterized protein n=1 Tax=Acetonema longum DSM 6540 TaxID=1009370 RepID=F7NPG3_9FIRM|nr:hypothetical protein [Acetonema longum]EGO62125.1 hypothetical protein ALO_20042 [Acetonema longum DSM 6540]
MTNEEFQKLVLEKLDKMDSRQEALENQVAAFQQFTVDQFSKLDKKITKTNLVIENKIQPAIKALAEGQTQQQGQLDRIEAKVSDHEEIIFKRIK